MERTVSGRTSPGSAKDRWWCDPHIPFKTKGRADRIPEPDLRMYIEDSLSTLSHANLRGRALEMSTPSLPADCLPPVYLGPYSGAEAIAIGFSMALWGKFVVLSLWTFADLIRDQVWLACRCMLLLPINPFTLISFSTNTRFLYFTKCVLRPIIYQCKRHINDIWLQQF